MVVEKRCVYNINPDIDPIKACGKEAKWEVGFSTTSYDVFMFECSGENEYQNVFCDEHFISLSGCCNVVEFRRIGEWLNFSDYDNPNILKKLTEEEEIIYIQKKSLKDWL